MNSAEKLKLRLAIILWLGFTVLAICTFSSCAITKKQGGKEETNEKSNTQEETTTNKNTKDYGFKKYSSNEWETIYEPVDVNKPTWRSEPDENGNISTQNLKETRRKKDTKGEATNTKEVDENATTKKTEETEASEESSWYEKFTARVPLYAVLILGFFGFAFLVFLVVAWWLARKANTIFKTQNEILQRLNITNDTF